MERRDFDSDRGRFSDGDYAHYAGRPLVLKITATATCEMTTVTASFRPCNTRHLKAGKVIDAICVREGSGYLSTASPSDVPVSLQCLCYGIDERWETRKMGMRLIAF